MSKEQEWASKQVDLFNNANDFRKQNSREARERSLPKADSDKGIILECLQSFKDHIFSRYVSGIDAHTISRYTQECTKTPLTYHAVQRRMSELVKADLVEVAGKKDGYTLYKIKQ